MTSVKGEAMEQQRTTDAQKWNLRKLPPAGNKDCGPFFHQLYKEGEKEKERLRIPERANANYRLYRGDHWGATPAKDKSTVKINLFFANVQRTKANLTTRDPVAEVVDMDGISDDASNVLSSRLKKWWKDTSQRDLLSSAAQRMELYGILVEKAVWNTVTNQPEIRLWDVFGFTPAPGNWRDIAAEAPYVCFTEVLPVEEIESRWNLKRGSVIPENVAAVKGSEREKHRPMPMPERGASEKVTYDSGLQPVQNPYEGTQDAAAPESRPSAAVTEIWIRDYTMETIEEEAEYFDERSGATMFAMEKVKRPKYPGNIRMAQFCNEGKIMLDDMPNPNINPGIPRELAANTYLYNNFPFWVENSYEDDTCIWGFSASEQVGDLLIKIDELVSKLVRYVDRAMFPPMVVPHGIGITRKHLNTKPNLVLMPNNFQAANFIRFVPIPNLPTDVFKVLDMLIAFFDRVYQIEDADRGEVPSRVIAASAIVALQERNAVLIHEKIKSIDGVVEARGRAAISLFQNFGWKTEALDVKDTPTEFRGIDYADRRFNYSVESGSTLPKTSLQVLDQLERYYQMGLVDRQAVLQNSGLPGWKDIVERVGEGQLNQALQILIQAGLPEEVAVELRNSLMQPQGGPGNGPQTPQQGAPGVAQEGGQGGGPGQVVTGNPAPPVSPAAQQGGGNVQ